MSLLLLLAAVLLAADQLAKLWAHSALVAGRSVDWPAADWNGLPDAALVFRPAFD